MALPLLQYSNGFYNRGQRAADWLCDLLNRPVEGCCLYATSFQLLRDGGHVDCIFWPSFLAFPSTNLQYLPKTRTKLEYGHGAAQCCMLAPKVHGICLMLDSVHSFNNCRFDEVSSEPGFVWNSVKICCGPMSTLRMGGLSKSQYVLRARDAHGSAARGWKVPCACLPWQQACQHADRFVSFFLILFFHGKALGRYLRLKEYHLLMSKVYQKPHWVGAIKQLSRQGPVCLIPVNSFVAFLRGKEVTISPICWKEPRLHSFWFLSDSRHHSSHIWLSVAVRTRQTYLSYLVGTYLRFSKEVLQQRNCISSCKESMQSTAKRILSHYLPALKYINGIYFLLTCNEMFANLR